MVLKSGQISILTMPQKGPLMDMRKSGQISPNLREILKTFFFYFGLFFLYFGSYRSLVRKSGQISSQCTPMVRKSGQNSESTVVLFESYRSLVSKSGQISSRT
jgi:hypothetical protein